jgi:hypothetical protein
MRSLRNSPPRPLALPRQHTPPEPLPHLFLEKGLSIEGKHFPALRNLLAPLKAFGVEKNGHPCLAQVASYVQPGKALRIDAVRGVGIYGGHINIYVRLRGAKKDKQSLDSGKGYAVGH